MDYANVKSILMATLTAYLAASVASNYNVELLCKVKMLSVNLRPK